jgi:hypothetical protein
MWEISLRELVTDGHAAVERQSQEFLPGLLYPQADMLFVG